MGGNLEEGLISSSPWANCEKAFDRLEKEEQVVFFDDIKIARDGGMHNLKASQDGEAGVFSTMRYFNAIMLVAFLVYNVHFILSSDISMLAPKYYEEAYGTPETAADKLVENVVQKDYLLSKFVLKKMIGENIEHVSPFAIIAAIELCYLAVLVVSALVSIAIFFCCTGYQKWIFFAKLCWVDLQHLAGFSAMKLLGLVVPQRLSYDLTSASKHTGLHVAWILITRPFCLIIGLDCFLVKYRQATEFIVSETITMHDVIGALVFLNQVVGLVNMTFALTNRLHRFVFAGPDGVMGVLEINKQSIWEAFVARTIINRYPLYKSIPLMLSWSDDDFQHMCLEDKAAE